MKTQIGFEEIETYISGKYHISIKLSYLAEKMIKIGFTALAGMPSFDVKIVLVKVEPTVIIMSYQPDENEDRNQEKGSPGFFKAIFNNAKSELKHQAIDMAIAHMIQKYPYEWLIWTKENRQLTIALDKIHELDKIFECIELDTIRFSEKSINTDVCLKNAF